jgi:hypothetical protein
MRPIDAVYPEVITADGKVYTLQRYTMVAPCSNEHLRLFAYVDAEGQLTDCARQKLERELKILARLWMLKQYAMLDWGDYYDRAHKE